jgi:hypothetical protein
MKIIRYLLIGLIVCATVVLLPWLFRFSDSGGLSTSPDDWADFGSYIGGTLSSLVAALALIALLYTISQQHRQIKILRRQASKEDIIHSIDRLERDLDKILDGVNIVIKYDNDSQSTSARDILFKPSAIGYQQAINSDKELLNYQHNPNYQSKIVLFEVFGLAAGELNQIRLYAEGLKELESKTGTSIVARYYYRKYKIAYSRLYDSGILTTKWQNEPET